MGELEFEYSEEWYDREYHKNKLGVTPDLKVKETQLGHVQRDLECLKKLELKETDDVLVAGCGGGNNLFQIKENWPRVKRVTSYDFSKLSVDFCAGLFPEFRIIKADAKSLPFPNLSFDKITMMDITEHLPHDIYLLSLWETYRLLRPGGRMVILPGMTDRPEHINLLRLSDIKKDLEEIGFQNIFLEYIWIVMEKTT